MVDFRRKSFLLSTSTFSLPQFFVGQTGIQEASDFDLSFLVFGFILIARESPCAYFLTGLNAEAKTILSRVSKHPSVTLSVERIVVDLVVTLEKREPRSLDSSFE